LDDIHAADEKEGLLEWLYMTRPTREVLLSLGGAAFSAIRRLPFFGFSTEEIVAAMVGRAAVCGKPGEALQCGACGFHGSFVDDNVWRDSDFEDQLDGGFNVIMRDCRCTICSWCMSEDWQNDGPLNDDGEIICMECERVYSSGPVSGCLSRQWQTSVGRDAVEKLHRIAWEGLKLKGGQREGGLKLRFNGKIVNDDDDADREDQMVPVLPPGLLWTRQGIYEDEAAWANPSYKKKPPKAQAKRTYFGLAKPWATSRAGGSGGAAAGGRSGGKGKKGRV
jgi:hypothetical protein